MKPKVHYRVEGVSSVRNPSTRRAMLTRSPFRSYLVYHMPRHASWKRRRKKLLRLIFIKFRRQIVIIIIVVVVVVIINGN
jgi:hypothetical protein